MIFAKNFGIIVIERMKNLELNDLIGIIMILQLLFMKLYPMMDVTKVASCEVKIFNSLSPEEIIRSDVSLSWKRQTDESSTT